jgi:UrcA family protein
MPFTLIPAMLLASVAPSAPQQTIHVTYDSADLVTEKGRRLFARRVDRAVREVCGGNAAPGSRLPSNGMLACRVETGEAAHDQVERAIAQATNQPVKVAAVRR